MLGAALEKIENKDLAGTYVWQDMPDSLPADKSLEQTLNFPRGTLAIFRKALDLRIPRKTQWLLGEGLSEKAFSVASRYYKRGNQASKLGSETDISFKCLDELKGLLSTLEYFVVCDSNVLRMWPGLSCHYTHRGPSESNKTLETLAELVTEYQKQSSGKPLLAIGGGVTLDVACFAAKLLGRGIKLVPTTLLSMVDASIGGKNGVNFWPYGKNLVGSFYFPQEMILCPEFLQTLSSRELRSGGAEALKHALLLYDKDLFKDLARALHSLDRKALAEKIPQLLQLKKDVVAQDPFESSYRMILNLGHTLAHAIEALSYAKSSEQITHGEAVCLGLYFMLLLSEKYHLLNSQESLFFREQLLKSSCLISANSFEKYTGHKPESKKTWLALQVYLSQDKKQSSTSDLSHNWVLLPAGGFKCGKANYLTSIPAHVSQSIWYNMWKTLGDSSNGKCCD